MSLIKATRIEDIYKSFDAAPLMRRADLEHFYVRELNETRGSDKIQTLAKGLRRQHRARSYKAFVMGHAGVGISTELSRLQEQVADQFRTLRLSANTDLDPVNFKPFDIILRIALGLAEKTAAPIEQGGAGSPLSGSLTRELLEWFGTEKKTVHTNYDVSVDAKAGAGPTPESLWAKLLGLNASLQLEAKRSSGRSKEVIEYREKNVGQLVELANRVLDDCNARLRDATGHEWLVIGDDFDKPGIPEASITNVFLTYGNILTDLHVHLILDVPIGLGHSSRANQLPAIFDGPHNFPDTPVYQKDHTPHAAGRDALRQVIAHRMDPNLFADGQQERVVVASGGNLRELFSLIVTASTNAEIRIENEAQAGTELRAIIDRDVTAAINELRKEYRNHLGATAYDIAKTDLPTKLAKLSDVYRELPACKIRDEALYSLLHARAVQEFNCEGWFGVHPLVVDFLSEITDLAELQPLRDATTGRLPGGSI